MVCFIPINTIKQRALIRTLLRSTHLEKVTEHLRNRITNKMTLKDIVDAFDVVKEYYDSEIINRAQAVLLYQKHKYQYKFN